MGFNSAFKGLKLLELFGGRSRSCSALSLQMKIDYSCTKQTQHAVINMQMCQFRARYCNYLSYVRNQEQENQLRRELRFASLMWPGMWRSTFGREFQTCGWTVGPSCSRSKVQDGCLTVSDYSPNDPVSHPESLYVHKHRSENLKSHLGYVICKGF